MEKRNRPDLESEMDELQRVVQDLNRDENMDLSVDDLVNAFTKSKEITLTDEIWGNLENTESNEIEKGDMDSVMNIAKMYKKTNPKKLSQSIKSGDYKRPLILKFGDRYHLVAGNTRLCTAAAIGVNPKVFIGEIKNINEMENLKGGLSDKKSYSKEDISKLISLAHKNITRTKGKEYAPDVHELQDWINGYISKQDTTESMGADSAGSFEMAFNSKPIKRPITKIHNMNEEADIDEAMTADSAGAYDVPFPSKKRKDPLSIGGEKSIKQSRAVKDKKFPKWGGPKGVYVKVKDKCKKFPYCNQGNTGALEFYEVDGLVEAVKKVSKKYGIPYSEMEKVVLNEINKIFIR
jgi:hypothetical protein